MAQIPTPLRAALGLMANAIEGARTLPDKAVELPVRAVSAALQFSLRTQQRYAELTLRGDELLGRLHQPPEEPPPWATFDDEEPAGAPEPALDAAQVEGAGDAALWIGRSADAPDLGSAADAGPSTPPDDIPISSADTSAKAAVKSAVKQPHARKAATKTSSAAAKTPTPKRVRAPRQAKPSAFDRTDHHD